MSGVKVTNSLLSSKQTRDLVSLVEEAKGNLTRETVAKNMRAIYHASPARTQYTVDLLVALRVFTASDGFVCIAKKSQSSSLTIDETLAAVVAKELVRRIAEDENWVGIKFSSEDETLTLDSFVVPKSSDGFGVWVLGFEVAVRKSFKDRYWTVHEQYKSLILEAAKVANQRRARLGKSAEELQKDLENQAEVGAIAEQWVVEFEKRRLASHPLKKQVKRISVENVAAGFDILSFTSAHTLVHDRFIEVKSYAGKKRFYWTKNELRKAAELGASYYLYLVDRNRTEDETYEPTIIQGPSLKLFETIGSGWEVEPSVYEFISLE